MSNEIVVRPCALCTARRQSFLFRGNLLHEECARVLLDAEAKAWRILGIVLATPFVALILAFVIALWISNARQEQHNAEATKPMKQEQVKPKIVLSAEQKRFLKKFDAEEARTKKY